MFTFGLLLVAAIVQPPTTGKGFGKPQAATKPKDIRNRPAVADFEAWAKESKIEKPIPLKIVDFGDERGVSAPERWKGWKHEQWRSDRPVPSIQNALLAFRKQACCSQQEKLTTVLY